MFFTNVALSDPSGDEESAPLKLSGIRKNLYAGYIPHMNARDTQYHYVELNYKLTVKAPYVSAYHYCYFFDRDKKLLHREESVYLREKNSRWEEYGLRQDLVLEEKRGTLGFIYEHDLKFKYLIFVFGNEKAYYIHTFPKHLKVDDFDLSELKQKL